MNNFTFFLGAGSSSFALPIGDNIPSRLIKFGESVLQDLYQMEPYEINWKIFTDKKIKTSRNEARLQLGKAAIYYGGEASKHASIDTLAKRYSITDKKRLKELKAVLTCFFIWHQSLSDVNLKNEKMYKSFDRRYDSFFASVLNKVQIDLPNIRVITWNYDLQFELAYRNYLKENDIVTIQKQLNVANTMIQESNSIGEVRFPRDEAFLNDFSILRLNGSAFIRGKIDDYGRLFELKSDSYDFIRKLSEIFLALCFESQIENELMFAWEQSPLQERIISLAATIIRKSNYIVIIGYSFPFFNRKVDSLIFSEAAPQKIYIQDPNATKMIDKVAAVTGVGNSYIQPVDADDRQFYFPHEF